MSDPKACPKCGKILAAHSAEVFCPACMMRHGLETGSVPTNQPKGRAFTPPSTEELSKFFPGLEIISLLGRGGMGAVYKVRQKQLNRIAALKILPPDVADDPSFAKRFEREAQALAQLNHANIVTLYEFGKVDGLYFFLMEFVDGLNLRQVLNAGKLAPKEALAIVPQICDALQFAHDNGIVHRDIKPENLLLDKQGRIKIADFGIAKILDAADSPAPGASSTAQPEISAAAGTLQYMAPEQKAQQNTDHRADIYSLGVVFYELLTGELPGSKLQPPSRKVEIDVRLDEIVMRALEARPERRYQTAGEFGTSVQTVSSPAAVTGPTLGVQESWEYKSARTLWGLPLLHVTAGMDPATGKWRVARGIFAFGGRAKGVFAFGGIAQGIFAFGGVTTGVVAVGGVAFGVVSLGGLALGLLLGLGGIATGAIAFGGAALGYCAAGGLALGYYAAGGLAIGHQAMGGEVYATTVVHSMDQMPSLFRFLDRYSSWSYLFYLLLLPISLASNLVPAWARKQVFPQVTPPRPPPSGAKVTSRLTVILLASLFCVAGAFAIWVMSNPTGLPAGKSNSAGEGEVRYRMFWADAATVEKLVPASLRSKVPPPSEGLCAPGGEPWQTAEIDAINLDKLLLESAKAPWLLVDDRCNFQPSWPGPQYRWNFSRVGEIAGDGSGYVRVAVTRADSALRLRTLILVQHQLGDILSLPFMTPFIEWQADAPSAGRARTFFMPLRLPSVRKPEAQKYLVVALDLHPGRAFERSARPNTTQFTSGIHTAIITDDNTDLHYAIYYKGNHLYSGGGLESNASNPSAWKEVRSIHLENGRTFSYQRDSASPDILQIDDKQYDLKKGRIFVLQADGRVENLALFPDLGLVRDPGALASFIEINPVQSAEPASGPVFLPVVELTVPYSRAIDFLSGRILEWPAEWRDMNRTGDNKEEERWIVDTGVAATAHGDGLMGHGTLATPCRVAFDEVTPEQVTAVVAGLTLDNDGMMPIKTGDPATQFFRTREGAAGVLEILDLGDNKRGLKLRYKLVKGAQHPQLARARDCVAIPRDKLIRVVAARRGVANKPESVVTLDGSASLPKSGELKYQWRQTSGPALKLSDEHLAKSTVALRIYDAAEYRFELTVSLNGATSEPAEVLVKVVSPDEKMQPPGGATLVANPEMQLLVDEALNPDDAIRKPALQRLKALGDNALGDLDSLLFAEKDSARRVKLAEVIARCCEGKVGYRVTLDLNPDGSGKILLFSDRSLLQEGAQKWDRMNGRQAIAFPEDELLRNPYSQQELAPHMSPGMKYVSGDCKLVNGRYEARAELSFSSFEELAAFASKFDKNGYLTLKGITLSDAGNQLRRLHYKKNAEPDKSGSYLLRFHGVKWEFVLNFNGTVQSHTARASDNGNYTWRFDAAQMLAGEAEYEAVVGPPIKAPIVEAEIRFFDFHDGFKIDAESFDITEIRKMKDADQLLAPRILTSSGKECEIKQLAREEGGALDPRPTGVTARLKPTLNGDTVHFDAKFSITLNQDDGNPELTTTREVAKSGDAKLGKPFVVDIGSGKEGRHQYVVLVFKKGDASDKSMVVRPALSKQEPTKPATRADPIAEIELKVARQQYEKVLTQLQELNIQAAAGPSKPGATEVEQKAEEQRMFTKIKYLEAEAARLRDMIQQRTTNR